MSKVLSTTVAIIGLQSAPRSPLTTTSAVLGLIPRCKHTFAGYAAPRVLWPRYVPSYGIVGESCGDAFQPMCK